MGREIERKFRVHDAAEDAWRREARAARRIVQGYVAAEADRSVRVRLDEGEGSLTLKGASRGAVRDEWEYPIPADDARAILDALCGGRVVDKTRHEVPWEGLLFEVDVFHGANEGLVVAEVELDREDREVPRPTWLGPEVTNDPRYLNARLAERPWRDGGDGAEDGEDDDAAAGP